MVSSDAGTSSSRREPLLLIDDEPFLLDLYRRVLGRTRPLAAECDSKRAAERLRAGEAFDGVICDVMMGGMTGFDIHSVVVDHRPELLHRFLFVTGGSLTQQEECALDATGRPVLLKPFAVPQLLAAVAKVMPIPVQPWEMFLDCGSWRDAHRVALEGQRGTLMIPVETTSAIAQEPVTLSVRVRGETMVLHGTASASLGAETGRVDGHLVARVELSVPKHDQLRLANALLAEAPAPEVRPCVPVARGSHQELEPPTFTLDGFVLRRRG